MRPEEKVRKHWAGIEKKIKACKSKEQALKLKESVCRKFAEDCKSEILYNFLTNYAERLIKRYFG